MKGLICYHSNSGSTRLMCQYASRKMPSACFDVLDIAAAPPNAYLNDYDVIGFATWTYYQGLQPRFAAFLDALPDLPGKPVFLLSSFGMMPGWVLRLMEQKLANKGCVVLGGHALHLPENYPPLIVKGMDSSHAPEAKELDAFHAFLAEIDNRLGAIQRGQAPAKLPVPFDWFGYLIRPTAPQKAAKDMGPLAVDASLCGGCKTCLSACAYQAIRFDKLPQFDSTRCQACYACFNHCPNQAIYTPKIRGKGQYRHPSAELQEKLNAGR